MKVGAVLLGEAGNLGDDLILCAVAEMVLNSWPERTLAFLSHGQHLPWQEIADRLGFAANIERRTPGRDIPLSVRERRLFADCDALVVGGGGLLQDVHNPYRPYQWLRYVYRDVPALGLGLGVGPLSSAWDRIFSGKPPFDRLYVRDSASQDLVQSRYDWKAEQCTDFVQPHIITALTGTFPTDTEGILGVALRAWPGLKAETLAQHIEACAREQRKNSVRFFVLEAHHGAGIDVDFTRAVARHLTLDADIHVYHPERITQFLTEMSRCSSAVSMKLHSSVIWSMQSIPIYPIVYAPKVAALFDRRYNGLEIVQEALTTRPDDGAPQARELGQAWLAHMNEASHRRAPVLFPRGVTLSYQLRQTFHSARRVLSHYLATSSSSVSR